MESLKKTYPQKYCLKIVCRLLYYIGCGECWYEETKRSKFEKIFYPLWAVLSNSFIIIGIINQLATHFIDLTPKEQNDLLQHSIAHPTIYMKVVVLYLQRSRVKLMLKKLLEETRSIFSSAEIDEAAMKKGFKFSATIFIVSYSCLFFTTMDQVRAHFSEDLPFRVEVAFYPRSSDLGIYNNILQFFVEIHWWYVIVYMVLVDSLTICALVTLEAKFKLLQIFFLNLRNIFMDNTEGWTQKELDDAFKNRFKIGIKLHEDALWCASKVQYALINICSVQIVQSLILFGICLVKFITTERTPTFLLATAFYIAAMVVLTGTYMMLAGDVTHEAAKVPMSIFHSGWERSHSLRELRPHIVMAIQRSMVPIKMIAFGILTLSYENFISVLRTSYSLCAVML